MAIEHHNVPVLFPDRFVTIRESYRYISGIPSPTGAPPPLPTTFPSMKLSGKWLEKAGFEPPQRVRIEVTPRCLILRPLDEEECDHLGRDGFPIVDSLTGLKRRERYAGKRKADASAD